MIENNTMKPTKFEAVWRSDKKLPCPVCQKNLDAVTNLDDNDMPGPGDITICAYCQTWLVYNKEMNIEICSQSYINTLPKEFQERLERMTVILKDFQQFKRKIE